ncbi:MAG: amidohydrolase family protein [Rhodospirillaceae bacterium]|nr:amidohydrolase family protein [Rhodospirillaceae bacterium]MDE0617614.1 amidohydrolase family protein [Rhodospirillaceae bacterium]
MPETIELLVRNVRRYDDGRKVDIAIADGLIRRISEGNGAVEPAEVLDLEGYFASPGFVEPHFHLDKCLAAEVALPGGTLDEQLEAFCEAKSRLSAETVAERACRMGRILASRGVVHVRSFADIDQYAELRILEGLKEARRRLEGLIDVQIVAFPQMGIFTHDNTRRLLEEALEMGVDAVGGHSELETSEAETLRQIDLVFQFARAFDVDADFHVDESDSRTSRWLETCARKAVEHGYRGRTSLGHGCAIAHQGPEYRRSVYAILKEADATVVSSPTSGLLFRGHGEANPPRGITMVKEMLDHGINVACAQEAYRSVFSRHLRFPDPLFTGQLMAYTAKLADEEGLGTVFRMLTANPAKALRLPDYGLAEGCAADLVFLKASSIFEALTLLSPERITLKRGRVVARSRFNGSVWNPALETFTDPLTI